MTQPTQNTAQRCTSCNTVNPAAMRFCERCGSLLPIAAATGSFPTGAGQTVAQGQYTGSQTVIQPQSQPPARRLVGLWLGIAAALVCLLLLGGIGFFATQKSTAVSDAQPVPAATVESAGGQNSAATTGGAPTAPSAGLTQNGAFTATGVGSLPTFTQPPVIDNNGVTTQVAQTIQADQLTQGAPLTQIVLQTQTAGTRATQQTAQAAAQSTAVAQTVNAEHATQTANAPTATIIPPTPTNTSVAAQVSGNGPLAGKLLFAQKNSASIWSIYKANMDGSGVQVIIPADNSGDMLASSVSPDGQWIAYVRNETDHSNPACISRLYQIWKIRADLSGSSIQLTDSSVEANHYPVWSADGNTIFYSSNARSPYTSGSFCSRPRPIFDIWRMDSNGGNKQLMSKDVHGSQAAVAGNTLLFNVFNVNAPCELRMGSTSGPFNTFVQASCLEYPAISADGQSIAATRGIASENSDTRRVVIYDRNGNVQWQSQANEIATYPSFSPDGRYLAYLAHRGDDLSNSQWGINILDLRTGNINRILWDGQLKFYLSWGR